MNWSETDLVLSPDTVTARPSCMAMLRRALERSCSSEQLEITVLYVREAHPGESVGPHRTMKDKLTASRLLEIQHDDLRRVLVDDLVGTAHRSMGGLLNRVYVLSPEGIVEFDGDWADTRSVAALLDGTPTPEMVGRRPVEGQSNDGSKPRNAWT